MEEEAVPGDGILLGKGIITVLGMSLGGLIGRETIGGRSVQFFGESINSVEVVSPLTDSLSTRNGILHRAALAFLGAGRPNFFHIRHLFTINR